MKVLILSVTTGEGHNSAARALEEAIRRKGGECVHCDAYKSTFPPIYYIIKYAYSELCSHYWRHLYGALYRWAERHIGSKSGARMGAFLNRILSSGVRRVLRREKPDAVIYTHVIGGQMLLSLKRRGSLTVPAIGVVTDFTLHPRWERLTSLGQIAVPHESLKDVAVSRGFPKEAVHVLGIPLHPKYNEAITKEEARAALGLLKDENVVLALCGKTGYGSPKKILLQADKSSADFRFLAICGNQKQRYRALSKLQTRHPMTTVLYTTDMNLYMAAADLVITKPGGLSSSEALSQGLPMYVVNPIPGHEDRNAEFLTAMGAALSKEGFPDLSAALDAFFADEGMRQALRERADALGHPHATEEIVQLAINEAAKAEE